MHILVLILFLSIYAEYTVIEIAQIYGRIVAGLWSAAERLGVFFARIFENEFSAILPWNMEVTIEKKIDERAICTLCIPHSLLYDWYLRRNGSCYAERLNSCISGQPMMMRSTSQLEERVRVQGSRLYNNVTRANRRNKRKILEKSCTIQIYEDEVVKPTELQDELSATREEVEESRYFSITLL